MKSLPAAMANSFLLFLLVFSITACTGKDTKSGKFPDNSPAGVQIASCLILPADTPVTGGNGTIEGRELENLTEGAARLSSILKNKVEDRNNMIFLSPNRKESLLGDYNGSDREIITYLGRATEAEAVFQPHIVRYTKRKGGKYSVSQPASINFSYRLVHTATGNTLCQGQFDETQKPLFSDLFSFFKASSRGFKWITADELLRENVEKAFDECEYLCDK